MLCLAPILAYIVSILDIFDIKKWTVSIFLADCNKKLHQERIRIWKESLSIQNISDQTQIDQRLCVLLEREERYDEIKLTLHRTRTLFDFYYLMLIWFLLIWVFASVPIFFFKGFFIIWSRPWIIFLLALLMTSLIFWLMFILYLKKSKMQKLSDTLITTINLT